MKKRSKLSLELEAAVREAIAHRRGEMALPARVIDPTTPARVKAIR